MAKACPTLEFIASDAISPRVSGRAAARDIALDDGDDATADDGGEGGATKVLTDLGASVTTMAEGMFATVGAPEEPE